MFSKELENLIQATLEDGVLEDYERAALVKRAQAEGVDLTELEIYINSILQKRKKDASEQKNAKYEKMEQEKREAFGKLCPNCGKQVAPLTLVCECGYEFTNHKKISSAQELLEKIDKLNSEIRPNNKSEINNRICDVITMFPVPNTKEDIIEFLSMAATNTEKKGGFLWGTRLGRFITIVIFTILIAVIFGGYADPGMGLVMGLLGIMYGCMASFMANPDMILYNRRAEAWNSKFYQVLMKGRSMRSDKEFQEQLDYFEQQVYGA